MKTVRIGVISDSHIKKFTIIPKSLEQLLKTVDLIIHLGDFTSPELFEYLKSLNNFHGVAGNHDPGYIKSYLPRTDVLEVNGKRLGLLHGYWFPLFCQHRSLARFKREKVDAVIYGHTHIIRNEVSNNMLFFNPGSIAAIWPAPWKTYGILNIGDTIKGEIVSLGNNQKSNFERYTDNLITRKQVLRTVCRTSRSPGYSLQS